jgi:hypothetical protein
VLERLDTVRFNMRRLLLGYGALMSLWGTTLGCEEKAPSAGQASGSVSAAASASAPPEDAPPAGCKASGQKPVELAQANGQVFGFVGDATHLYYATWQLHAGRGDLARVRKDGGGLQNLTSVTLEPRDVAVDDTDIFYTQGIRLMKVAKGGGEAKVVDDNFSSQSIDIFGEFVFGVPGDYGPYDRFIRQPRKGGASKELHVEERPDVKDNPVGYSAVVVDASGAYVTDSGRKRVLRFEHDRAEPKVVTAGQPKAYSLAVAGDTLYFTLAIKGELLSVEKKGGKAKKLSSGLAPKAKIVADEAGVLALFSGTDEDAPKTLAGVSRDGGDPVELARIPAQSAVQGLALDQDCIYWAEREAGSGDVKIVALAR